MAMAMAMANLTFSKLQMFTEFTVLTVATPSEPITLGSRRMMHMQDKVFAQPPATTQVQPS
jgi:hypothetical protein